MRFTAKAFLIDFDKKLYLDDLREAMYGWTKEAAHSWLRTVLAIIPVWSEASHATFNQLAEAVGFPLPLGNAVARKDRRNLGFSTGSGGIDTKDERKGYIYFWYASTLRYLAWNEYNRAVKGDGSGVFARLTNPGPYRFQDAGEADFRSFAENVKLTNPFLDTYLRGKAL
jgi:hypothetical protein